MPNLIRKNKRSFLFLNVTQFLGALNDNVFKLLIVYFLISIKGVGSASTILATAGLIFVLPFLLFSSAAGILADRISKRSIIVGMKGAEILIMSVSVVAFIFKSEAFIYALLFLMAMQSAVFGPSKFGIIPEIVDSKKVSKANGILASFTYIAIIFGTFLASFLTDVTKKNFILASIACVLLSIVGFIASLGIVKTSAKRSTKKINPLFLYEIYKTLALSYKRKHLLTAIIGCSFFLFIGGFVQLNTIPFAIQSLHMSDIMGGYLFLTTAIGIAIGSILAGKISKDRIEIGLSCMSGFFISIMFFILFFFSNFLHMVIISMILLGVFGGMFLIPLESFIQIKSPDKRRGQVIAASNFLSFGGVMLASFFLYLISGEFGLSASGGFGVMGILCFFVTLVLSGRMSDLFFPYLGGRIIGKFYPLKKEIDIPSTEDILFIRRKKWIDLFFLFSIFPSLKIIVIGSFFKRFPFINGFFNTLFRVSSKRVSDRLLAKIEKIKTNKDHILIIVDSKDQLPESLHSHLIQIKMRKEKVQKIWWRLIYFKKQYVISFDDNQNA
jgi:acyl-[acyl-carrier-protein]-phospholipid O-acyltransferase / long-chain-fatty-acid--[acyl-carrier-protein] ligase